MLLSSHRSGDSSDDPRGHPVVLLGMRGDRFQPRLDRAGLAIMSEPEPEVGIVLVGLVVIAVVILLVELGVVR